MGGSPSRPRPQQQEAGGYAPPHASGYSVAQPPYAPPQQYASPRPLYGNQQQQGGWGGNPSSPPHHGGYPGSPGSAATQPGGAASPYASPATTARRKAKTVRNDVNLKKHTLKMVPLEGEPATFYPTFRFDCGAPCAVSIFYLATEDTGNKLSLSTRLGEVGPRVHYEKQLGCVFPPSGMDASELRRYCVDVTDPACGGGKLFTHGHEVFPLCVRLECVAADEAMIEHRIDSVPVGGAMPGWIQSQTTYACLPKREKGLDVKVLKQKIWVRETAYELQEIYGLENANRGSAAGGGDPSDDIGRECVICMSEPRDTTLLPCRHMCLCHECAKMLRTQTNKCPICRTPVQSLLEITVKT